MPLSQLSLNDFRSSRRTEPFWLKSKPLHQLLAGPQLVSFHCWPKSAKSLKSPALGNSI